MKSRVTWFPTSTPRKGPKGFACGRPKSAAKKVGGVAFVLRVHDGVVELDVHGCFLSRRRRARRVRSRGCARPRLEPVEKLRHRPVGEHRAACVARTRKLLAPSRRAANSSTR